MRPSSLNYPSDLFKKMLNINLSPFPVLVTERLILRQPDISDANDLLILRSDEKVNEFIDRPKTLTIEDAKTFIEKINNGIANNQCMYWAITQKGNSSVIGTICCWNIDLVHDMGEIGYELKPESQGKGIMLEAISKVIEFGFKEVNLKVITALLKKNNIRSIQLLLRKDFKLDANYTFVSKQDAGDLLVYYLVNPVG